MRRKRVIVDYKKRAKLISFRNAIDRGQHNTLFSIFAENLLESKKQAEKLEWRNFSNDIQNMMF